jgi:hypothetical protein
MVWPAIYVSQALWKFWFLVIATIVIETFVIKYFLKFGWKKSFIASLIGNCVSGFVGTFIMVWAMLFWHMVADNFVPHGTFGLTNWIATYILMCLGSVFLEALAIRFIYKEKIRRLFLPMLTGNFLSYAFIAYAMFTATSADPDEKRAETIKFLPNKQQFVLLDSSKMHINTATISISIGKNGKRLNDTKSLGYNLNIPFIKQNQNSFQFDFRALGEEDSKGIDENHKDFHFINLKNEYKILLEQKSPDTSLGWRKPIITDTLIFKRLK